MLHSVLTPEQAASTPIYAGLVIGITLLGWGVGGLVGGILADYVGRKRMMLWSVFLYAVLSGFLQSGFGWGTLVATVVWYAVSSFNPMGEETWRLMFLLGAVPALFVLYIRRGVDESEQWQQAVREKRWNATDASLAAGSERRPFTLAQLFAEPETRRQGMPR